MHVEKRRLSRIIGNTFEEKVTIIGSFSERQSYVKLEIVLILKLVKCMSNNCLEWDKGVLNQRPFG